MIEDKNFIAELTKVGVQVTAKENAFLEKKPCSVDCALYHKLLLEIGANHGVVEVTNMNFEIETSRSGKLKKDSVKYKVFDFVAQNQNNWTSAAEMAKAANVKMTELTNPLSYCLQKGLMERQQIGERTKMASGGAMYKYRLTGLGKRKYETTVL